MKCPYEKSLETYHMHLVSYKKNRLYNYSKTIHNFNFNAVTMLAPIRNKWLRQIFEAITISFLSSFLHMPDFSIYQFS